MCERGTERIVEPPAYWKWHHPTICVDSCIADEVLALWAEGIITLGSCCGHGKRRPSLVLNEDRNMAELARQALASSDRNWELLQWQLVDVTA